VTLLHLDPGDLATIWPLTGVSIGETLPSYPTRRVFRVHADQGEFVAKVDRAPGPDVAGAEELHVLEYLTDRDFAHAPALLRTRSGHHTARIGDYRISVIEFIPRALHQNASTPGTWSVLGQAAARLNAFGDYPLPFAIPLRAALEQLAGRVMGLPFEDRFLELLARAGELEQEAPDALVHGEINNANTRWREDGSVVLVDWDQAGCAPAAMEYGYPLITVFLSEDEHAFDDRSACSFIHGYVEAGGSVEARQMFNAALFHALRYMWWGSTERRWERILDAATREAELCAVLP
jgi:Ser/Thr protein kinase RdoA (MazF antagonist)